MSLGAQTLLQPVALLLGEHSFPALPVAFLPRDVADFGGARVAWSFKRLLSFCLPPPVRVRLAGTSPIQVVLLVPTLSHSEREPWRACVCCSASAHAGKTPDLHEAHNLPASPDCREACSEARLCPSRAWMVSCLHALPCRLRCDGSCVLAPV